MAKVPAIIPVTDLRQDAAAALKRVRTSRQPVVITQRGRAAAIMLSIEAYENREHERELLRLLVVARGRLRRAKGTTSPVSWLRLTACWRLSDPCSCDSRRRGL